MSDTLRNVSDYLQNIEETVASKARDILSELESDLNELDEYRNLFDDEYDARDCKDYCEEMQDIFDDTYAAQQAYDFYSSAEYAGLEDEDLEAVAEELEQYRALGDIDEVREAVAQSDGGVRVADLERELAEARDLIAKQARMIEGARVSLESIGVDEVKVMVAETEADLNEQRREAEEGAYVAGIMDHATFGEQGIPLDLDLSDDEA